MKLFALIALTSLTFGCATKTIEVDLPNIEESAVVVVNDLRPELEKEKENFSSLITNASYGISRLGDEIVEPSPIRIFQHKLYEKYSDQNAVPEVKVHHLIVYANSRAELRRGATWAVFGGVVGAVISEATQKSAVDAVAKLTSEEEFNAFEEEYQRALYTEEENPNKVSVYRVFLEAEINEKRTFVSTMTPTALPNEDEREPYQAALETAIAYFLDQY